MNSQVNVPLSDINITLQCPYNERNSIVLLNAGYKTYLTNSKSNIEVLNSSVLPCGFSLKNQYCVEINRNE